MKVYNKTVMTTAVLFDPRTDLLLGATGFCPKRQSITVVIPDANIT